jgi:hypothetical protein
MVKDEAMYRMRIRGVGVVADREDALKGIT